MPPDANRWPETEPYQTDFRVYLPSAFNLKRRMEAELTIAMQVIAAEHHLTHAAMSSVVNLSRMAFTAGQLISSPSQVVPLQITTKFSDLREQYTPGSDPPIFTTTICPRPDCKNQVSKTETDSRLSNCSKCGDQLYKSNVNMTRLPIECLTRTPLAFWLKLMLSDPDFLALVLNPPAPITEVIDCLSLITN